MKVKLALFIEFLMREKVRRCIAFFSYILCIYFLVGVNDLPVVLQIIIVCILELVYMIYLPIHIVEKSVFEQKQTRIEKTKKIVKEIIMFIPILLISYCVTNFIMIGQPVNEISLNNEFYEAPIYNSILLIIMGPIMEEYIFRYLPYKFIKNKILYVVVSTVVFAAMHVTKDPKWFYYIWFYMLRAWYYGYRYYKTKDLLVPICMHSFNNLVSTILFVLS